MKMKRSESAATYLADSRVRAVCDDKAFKRQNKRQNKSQRGLLNLIGLTRCRCVSVHKK